VPGTDPDQAYIDKGLSVCEERIMYAGSRLAALMVEIYGSNSAQGLFLQ
jgi:hypothetical protein